MKEKITLPADVYDALELSALVHTGVGSGCLSESNYELCGANACALRTEVPTCIIGHALFLDGYGFSESAIVIGQSPVCDALVAAFPDLSTGFAKEFPGSDNYRGVIREIELLNDDQLGDAEGRITWKQWCKRMNVVRGDN